MGHDAKQAATKSPAKLGQTPKKRSRSTAECSDGDINKTPVKRRRFSNSNPDKKNTITSNNTEVQPETFGSGYNHQLTSFSAFAEARAEDGEASSKGSERRNAPTNEELRKQGRYKTWAPSALNWQCPWGCGKAGDCGGRRKNLCEKYGDGGTHVDSRPTEAQLKQIKKDREKICKAQSRAAAKKK